MHSDVYKIHIYLGVATYISDNRLCKSFPHNLGTNAATYLFVFPYEFWDGEGEMSMLFKRWKKDNQIMKEELVWLTNS